MRCVTPLIRRTIIHSTTRAALLTALLALGSVTFAATPAETPNTPDAATQPAATSGSANTTSTNPEVSGGVLPLLPAQPPTGVSGGVLPLLPEPQAPAVARDVGVEKLPLLVTEPPKGDTSAAIPAPVTGGKDSTLNPFSPLLLPQPAPTPAAEPALPTAPPTQPPAAPVQPAPTPAPAAAAPTPATVPVPLPPARTTRPTLPAGLAANLRTAVPLTANLSANPLNRTLGAQSTAANALGPASELAAVRTPPSLTPLGTAATPNAAARIPSGAQQVALGSGLSTLGLGGNSAGDGNLTSLGGNRVSRALSSLRVHFTAMATGTAIFRVGDDSTPILLALGESLPGTGLTLTNLTSRGAQFTEDDVRHTLFLTP